MVSLREPHPIDNESSSRTRGRIGGHPVTCTTLAQESVSTSRKATFLALPGPNGATVAVAHSMIVSAWHMLSAGETYKALGGNHSILGGSAGRTLWWYNTQRSGSRTRNGVSPRGLMSLDREGGAPSELMANSWTVEKLALAKLSNG